MYNYAFRSALLCRERWTQCLDPEINRSPFTSTEDKLLIELDKQLQLSQEQPILSASNSRSSDTESATQIPSIHPVKGIRAQILAAFPHRIAHVVIGRWKTLCPG